MVGLTRFFCLMNLCEKSMVSLNVYKGIALFKKDAEFRLVKNFLSYKESSSGRHASNRLRFALMRLNYANS